MVRRTLVNSLVYLLVAVALGLFVLLSGITFNFSLGNYLFFILLALVVYLLFLTVFFRSNRSRRSEFRSSKGEPIVEYKSPAMESFDEEYKKAIGDSEDLFEESEEEFVGTDESKMYHKKSCRFAKLIKPKYRVEGSKDFFRKKKFKACSVCKPNKK